MSRRTKARQMIEGRAAASLEALQAAQPSFLGSIFESMPDYLGRQQLARQAQADQALAQEMAAREALGAQQTEALLPGAMVQSRLALEQAGVTDPQALFGVGMQFGKATTPEQIQQALETTAQVAASDYSPFAMQQRQYAAQKLQNEAAEAQFKAQREQAAYVQQQNERYAPLLQGGRDLGVIADMGTILKNVGTETAPTAARGAYAALRTRALDAVRREFEAGALQAAELEFFESLVPEGNAFWNLNSAERFARLNEMDYWFRGKLEDKIALMGIDATVADFDRFGRSYDEIVTPLGGLQPGLPQGGQAGYEYTGQTGAVGIDQMTQTPGLEGQLAKRLGMY